MPGGAQLGLRNVYTFEACNKLLKLINYLGSAVMPGQHDFHPIVTMCRYHCANQAVSALAGQRVIGWQEKARRQGHGGRRCSMAARIAQRARTS